MRRYLLGLGVAVFSLCGHAWAADSASGELTANGDRVELSAVAVETGLDQAGLLITDRPLPDGCGPYDAFMLASSGKLRGVAVSLSMATKAVEPAGMNGLFHMSWGGKLGAIGEPEVSIEQFDEERLRGSVALAEGSFADHTFAYSVEFDVSLKSERGPIEATIDGETDSAPAKAYIAYYQAMMALELDEGKKFAIKEHADQITGEDAEFFLEFFQDGHPREATIVSVEENGDQATLKVEGEIPACDSSDEGSATVQMVKEADGWKVQLESWEM